MRLCARTSLGCLIAIDLLLVTGASCAQQTPSTAAASTTVTRRGYFTRVQTQATAAAPTRARYGGRLDATAVAGRGTASDDRFGNDLDPLRPYGEPVRSTSISRRPYEPAPTISPPQRELPAPSVSHNYFPGMRPGQGPNRNVVVPHCVPGRHAFFSR
jgi:hypothetical protein